MGLPVDDIACDLWAPGPEVALVHPGLRTYQCTFAADGLQVVGVDTGEFGAKFDGRWCNDQVTTHMRAVCRTARGSGAELPYAGHAFTSDSA
jgi:hypothetical protein